MTFKIRSIHIDGGFLSNYEALLKDSVFYILIINIYLLFFMGFFERIISNFIDRLTILDVSSMIAIYAMFLLLMLNVWTSFKMSNLAQFIHAFIFIFTSAFYISLYSFNKEVLYTVVFNSSFLKFAYLLNIALFLPYIIYSKEKIKYNKHLDNDFTKNGTYDNYNYYYSCNNDKYAEPYTSKSKINHKYGNTQEVNSWDEYEDSISEDDNDFNINKIIVTDIDLNDGNERIFNKKVDNIDQINYYDCHEYINEVSRQRSFKEIVSGVKNVIQENNSAINEKVNLITENMLELKDSFQGAVDRIAKIFELFAVVIKKN